MTRLSALLAALVVTAALASACGTSSDSIDPTDTAAVAASPTVVEEAPANPTSVPDQEPDADPTATSAPAPTPTAEYDEFFGLQSMVLLTPIEGEGIRPVFSWDAVPGADRYFLILLDPVGEGYWSWEGEGTEIVLGGFPVLEDGLAGPQVSPGMTWSVSTADAEGRVIAFSEFRPISP